MQTLKIKLFVLIGLLLAVSCSTDSITEDSLLETEEKLKSDTSDDFSNTKKLNDNNKSKSNSGQKSFGEDGIALDSTYALYIDIDATEADYNSNPDNPSYTGPFNVYYRNLMSSHFTIYNVTQNDNADCGNLERWIVDLAEFNQYLVSIGEPTVSNNDDHDTVIVGNVTGGSTSNNNSATLGGDPESDVKGKGKKDDDEDDEEEVDPDLFPEMQEDNVNHCFSF